MANNPDQQRRIKFHARDFGRLIWCAIGAAAGIDIALWQPVGLSILILGLVALAWSRVDPGMVHYQAKWFDQSPPSILWGGWDEQDDSPPRSS
jgi:hypothetical protein